MKNLSKFLSIVLVAAVSLSFSSAEAGQKSIKSSKKTKGKVSRTVANEEVAYPQRSCKEFRGVWTILVSDLINTVYSDIPGIAHYDHKENSVVVQFNDASECARYLSSLPANGQRTCQEKMVKLHRGYNDVLFQPLPRYQSYKVLVINTSDSDEAQVVVYKKKIESVNGITREQDETLLGHIIKDKAAGEIQFVEPLAYPAGAGLPSVGSSSSCGYDYYKE